VRILLCCSALAAASWLTAQSAHAAAFTIAHNTPAFAATAQRAATVAPDSVIDVTLWLNLHNKDALDKLVAREYDRQSPSYRQFITRDALGRLIGPSDDEVASVMTFAAAHNLSMVARDKYNLFLRVRGAASDLQRAFSTQLAYVTFRGKTYRTNLSDPVINDAAGAHIMAVEGLDDMGFAHHILKQSALVPHPAGKAARAVAASAGLTGACFGPSATFTYPSNESGATGAAFTGTVYDANNGQCGYTPAQIQAAYGLPALYNKGLNGAGQTIAIVDWCGSPTITGDANAFSAKYGLPALTSSNFTIVNYPGQSLCAAPDPEINLDVEWSHAIAPGASIVLMVPQSSEYQDIDASWLYIVENGVSTIVSNSYGSLEAYTPQAVLLTQNAILEAAAAVGVSFQFSTGDDGDYSFGGVDTPTVSAPADSPYATAVGGVSLALGKDGAIDWQTNWGTNLTLLSDEGYIPVPSLHFGFQNGSGGGMSGLFAKPSFQKSLPGKARLLPDVSWLADPTTGAIIAITEPGGTPEREYLVYGGTSLSCPMFSALWAIANQAAGSNLGLAAPFLYSAPASTFADIVPLSSPGNVTGVISNGNATYHEGSTLIAEPLQNTRKFISVIANAAYVDDTAYAQTYGTDTSLIAKPGWDNSTGLGVANPAALIQAVTPAAK
jgi:subtilase family serine protease